MDDELLPIGSGPAETIQFTQLLVAGGDALRSIADVQARLRLVELALEGLTSDLPKLPIAVRAEVDRRIGTVACAVDRLAELDDLCEMGTRRLDDLTYAHIAGREPPGGLVDAALDARLHVAVARTLIDDAAGDAWSAARAAARLLLGWSSSRCIYAGVAPAVRGVLHRSVAALRVPHPVHWSWSLTIDDLTSWAPVRGTLRAEITGLLSQAQLDGPTALRFESLMDGS